MKKQEKIQRLEFHISYSCNNDCVFCSESDRLKQFGAAGYVSLNKIKKVLKEKSLCGYKHVNFTGGEPTQHPDFGEIIKYAKSLGYRIYVGTNGNAFKSLAYANKILPFIDELSFSLHGPTARIHNGLTKSTNFEKIITGLKKSKEINPKIQVFVNTVVVRKNFPYLEVFIKFLQQFPVDQLLISNLAPEGKGLCHYEKLAVTISQWKELFSRKGEEFQSNPFLIRFFGLPLCVLGSHQACSNDLYWTARTTVEIQSAPMELVNIDDYKPLRNRTRVDKCANCGYAELCGGIFEKYYKTFGDEEL